MSIINPPSNYESGLKALLDLCEGLFGKYGKPILLNSSHPHGTIKISKNSHEILTQINASTRNPLVKLVTNAALTQYELVKDHSLYLVILAINIYFHMKLDSQYTFMSNEAIGEISSLVNKVLGIQGTIHRIFDINFENLLNIAISISQTKLPDVSAKKLESFCKLFAKAILDSFSGYSNMTDEKLWIRPNILLVPNILEDCKNNKTGDIYEGFLFCLDTATKWHKEYFQKVMLLRSMTVFNKSAVVKCVIFDKKKTMTGDGDETDIKGSAGEHIDKIEANFISLLEKHNVGILLSPQRIGSNFKLKLQEACIFYIEKLESQLLSHMSKVYQADMINSMMITTAGNRCVDFEDFIFSINLPVIKQLPEQQGYFCSYLAVPKHNAITVILYQTFDKVFRYELMIGYLIFDTLSRIIFKFNKSNSIMKNSNILCHGSGCPEFIIAGHCLRSIPSAASVKATNIAINRVDILKQAVAMSFLKLWQLTNNSNKDSDVYKSNMVGICQKNFNCICHNESKMDNSSDLSDTSDLIDVKYLAIDSALKLVQAMMNVDGCISSE